MEGYTHSTVFAGVLGYPCAARGWEGTEMFIIGVPVNEVDSRIADSSMADPPVLSGLALNKIIECVS